jgi:hypothetical protein
MRTHSADNDRNRSSRLRVAQNARCLVNCYAVGAFMPSMIVAQNLLGLGCSCVSLATEFAGSGGPTVIEEAREERLEEGAEDDLGTTDRCC